MRKFLIIWAICALLYVFIIVYVYLYPREPVQNLNTSCDVYTQRLESSLEDSYKNISQLEGNLSVCTEGITELFMYYEELREYLVMCIKDNTNMEYREEENKIIINN